MQLCKESDKRKDLENINIQKMKEGRGAEKGNWKKSNLNCTILWKTCLSQKEREI